MFKDLFNLGSYQDSPLSIIGFGEDSTLKRLDPLKNNTKTGKQSGIDCVLRFLPTIGLIENYQFSNT
jgi:hypothetical protein